MKTLDAGRVVNKRYRCETNGVQLLIQNSSNGCGDNSQKCANIYKLLDASNGIRCGIEV